MVKRIIYPPVWLVLGVIAVFACNEYYPGLRYTGLVGQVGGGILIVAGLLLLVNAGGLFTKAGTDLVPFKNVTTLVTAGVYQFTRNPMYLGMVAVLTGVAITVGAATALVLPVLFVIIIELRYIRPEEEMLRGLFPEEFAAYCKQVRRWI
ncbi:MAG: protein-S-isoprenylcysteine O-methyltransferase Ste14 [Halioglobus sp.]|jgi:protein-S-isoprenylcysteine O-methyltransferase Ste14